MDNAPLSSSAVAGREHLPAVARTVADVRGGVARARAGGRSIGLVPTMGALHEGHLSLIRRARAQCDYVVVSIFVNPTQFGPGEDLEAYPRDEGRDLALAGEAGAQLAFVPAAEEVYPEGFSTTVAVAGVTERLCGAARGPEHFSGVATVVTKLLHIVPPDVAFFGQKDFQQTVVIRRLVADLDIPVQIEVCPTVREPDGLALSSRNAYLTDEQRARALALHEALTAAERAIADGERSAERMLAAGRDAMAARGVEPGYLELVDPGTLEPLTAVEGRVLVAVAAQVGAARLIDNALVEAPLEPASNPDLAAAAPAAASDLLSIQPSPPGPGRTDAGARHPCSA
jgi:pantoate--beta-alanine ligase